MHFLRSSVIPASVGRLIVILGSCIAFSSIAHGAADAYAGTFSDESITLTLESAGDAYTGTLNRGKTVFPVKAHVVQKHLEGSFSDSRSSSYDFTAALEGDTLRFKSGKRDYELKRHADASAAGVANPLDVPEPPTSAPSRNAPDADADAADVQRVGNFVVLGTTDKGKTLFVKLGAQPTLEAAIKQTADALAKAISAKLTISSAFANKNKNDGGAPFVGKADGHDVRGVILCGIAPSASTASVIVASADATQADVTRLFGFLPMNSKLQTHRFPDGSGSIDLPNGWTTQEQTAAFGIVVHGPAGQAMGIGTQRVIYESGSSIVRNANQTYQISMSTYNMQVRNYQQSLAMHQRYPNTLAPIAPQKPVPPNPDPNVQFPNVDFCQYCDGIDDVIKYWYPVGEAKGKRAGGGYTSVDQVIKTVPGESNPLIPGSASGVAYLRVIDHNADKTTTPIRVIARFATAEIAKGENWQLSSTIMRGPDVTFDRDLPVMQAILNSVQLDMGVCNQKLEQTGNAIREQIKSDTAAMTRRNKEFLKAQDEHFQRFEAQIAAQQQAVHDSASDTIEYCLGVRDVYDRATGKMLSVDLFNSHAITAGLNEVANDPGRFTEVPLRYER